MRLTTLLILLCVACMAAAAAATGAIPAAAEAADKAKPSTTAAHPASLQAEDDADKREDKAIARMKRHLALSILSKPKSHRPKDQTTPAGDGKGPAYRLRAHPIHKYQSTLIVLKMP